MKLPPMTGLGLLFAIVFAPVELIFAQGDLTPPPGPPAPTMKRLDQLEPRTIVNATNTPGDATNAFIISVPGSYYLTGNLTGATGKHGLRIQASDVTIDLNGFEIIGSGEAFRGIDIPGPVTNITICNGTVRGWNDGGVRADGALAFVEKLRVSNNVGATGLVVGNGSLVKDCVSSANKIGFSSLDRTHLSNCISTVNTGIGFLCSNYVTAIDCTSSRNGSSGFSVQASCSVIRCNSSRNTSEGIVATDGCTITDCTVGINGDQGIYVASSGTVRNCTIRGNTFAGIQSGNNCHILENTCDSNQYGINAFGAGSRIDGNSCTGNTATGFFVTGANNLVIRNSTRGNGTAYNLAATTSSGPIVTSSGGAITSTSPWANFAY